MTAPREVCQHTEKAEMSDDCMSGLEVCRGCGSWRFYNTPTRKDGLGFEPVRYQPWTAPTVPAALLDKVLARVQEMECACLPKQPLVCPRCTILREAGVVL